MSKRIEFLQDLKQLLTKHDVELEGFDEREIETGFADHNLRDINFGAYVDIDTIESLIEEIIKEDEDES